MNTPTGVTILEIELRTLQLSGLSFDDNKMKVSGYVNKTGQPSAVLGSPESGQFREVIQPGVFTRALSDNAVVDFYSEHDPHAVLATTTNGTLALTEDATGLYMQAEILPTSFGRDTYELIKSGVITGMSFGMKVLDDSWSVDTDGVALRTVHAIRLIEVSAVRHPAYPDSTLEARGITLANVKVPDNLKGQEVRSMAEDKQEGKLAKQDIQNLITVVSDLTDRMKDLLGYINENRSKKAEKAEETRSTKPVDEKPAEKRDDDDADIDDSDVETDSKDEPATKKKAADEAKKVTKKGDNSTDKAKSDDKDDLKDTEPDSKDAKSVDDTKKSDEKRSLDDEKLKEFIEFFDSDLSA